MNNLILTTMVIERIMEIPADRRIIVELPADVPAGSARVRLSVSRNAKPAKVSRQMRNILKHYGCLKDSPVFEGDPVEIQRRMRAEWNDSRENNG